jgi:prophage regulatory protein
MSASEGCSPRLLRLPAVLQKVGLGRSRWYDEVRTGNAPGPVRLSERAVAWREDEIDEWIDSRPRARTPSVSR